MTAPLTTESALAAPALGGVIEYLQQRLGLAIPPERRGEIEKRMRRVAAAFRMAGPDRVSAEFLLNRDALEALVDEVTVGETYFFRDPTAFDFIRNTILPDLEHRRPPGLPFQIWSAGCATGEEAYSLAMLLEEEGRAERAHILATDISQDALAKARSAVYGPWALRGDDGGRLAVRYFVKEASHFRLADRFRSRVRFRYLNLAANFQPSPDDGLPRMDLILCRNVLIYLDADTVRAVARRLYNCLADGGWLLTGPSDPPLWPHAPFKTLITAAGIVYRREDRAGAGRMPEKARGLPEVAGHRQFPPVMARAAVGPAVRQGPHAQRQNHDPETEGNRDFRAIRALADQGRTAAARHAAAEAIRRNPLCLEPRYLLATLALAEGQPGEAAALLRQLIYVDPDLAAAHMLLGTALLAHGEPEAARRAFENAFALAAERPASEIVPLTDGETAATLAQAARQQLERLAALPEEGA